MPPLMKLLIICNALITLILVAVVAVVLSTGKRQRQFDTTAITRTKRLEIVDQGGKVKAVLECNQENGSQPKLVLYNTEGREAVFITVNSKGYGTIYFQNRLTDGKVSVGYLWGSDTPTPSTIDDPLSSWGIRVRGVNGTTGSFGLLNSGQPIAESKAASGPKR
jgi:hypothetical protein